MTLISTPLSACRVAAPSRRAQSAWEVSERFTALIGALS
ncbi:hypothetical protein HMPREF1484_00970 [Dermabacter sp. HFH0086]|uniref:Uncharacterized protein n=1 Tax=Dermabacter hominis 1368 TaxID=1450519 RepID=A0ABR4SPF5_9MICO|nr:hypothetical protein HMPREF1484_00970 [Dermabacter sp. HFH0086]KDS94513.1 hypothetical protein DHOM_00470 [Dermabacter hominis 1368]